MNQPFLIHAVPLVPQYAEHYRFARGIVQHWLAGQTRCDPVRAAHSKHAAGQLHKLL